MHVELRKNITLTKEELVMAIEEYLSKRDVTYNVDAISIIYDDDSFKVEVIAR